MNTGSLPPVVGAHHHQELNVDSPTTAVAVDLFYSSTMLSLLHLQVGR